MNEPGLHDRPDQPGAAGAEPRPIDLRVARVHLRMGSLDLARAELEAFAGASALDPDALLDLAEVRWRTGDLGGAGVAAEAHLDTGAEAPLAMVIAAEAAAANARYGEARKLAARAVELLGDDLDALFAGMPRSAVWPGDRYGAVVPAGALFGDEPAVRAGGVEAGAGPLVGMPAGPAPTAFADDAGAMVGPSIGTAVDQAALWGEDAEAATPAPGEQETTDRASVASGATEELAAARAAAELGDHDEAARRLADLLARRPDLAATILGALPPDADARDQGADPDRPG